MASCKESKDEILNFIQNTTNPRALFTREGNLNNLDKNSPSIQTEIICNVQRMRQRNFCTSVKVAPQIDKSLFTGKSDGTTHVIDSRDQFRGKATFSETYQGHESRMADDKTQFESCNRSIRTEESGKSSRLQPNFKMSVRASSTEHFMETNGKKGDEGTLTPKTNFRTPTFQSNFLAPSSTSARNFQRSTYSTHGSTTKHVWNSKKDFTTKMSSMPCSKVSDPKNLIRDQNRDAISLIDKIDDDLVQFVIPENSPKFPIQSSESIKSNSEKFKSLTHNPRSNNRDNQLTSNFKFDKTAKSSLVENGESRPRIRVEKFDGSDFILQKKGESDFSNTKIEFGIADSDDTPYCKWSSSLGDSSKFIRPHSWKYVQREEPQDIEIEQPKETETDASGKCVPKKTETKSSDSKLNYDEYSPEFFSNYFKKLKNKSNCDSQSTTGLGGAQAEMKKMLTTLKNMNSCLKKISLEETEMAGNIRVTQPMAQIESKVAERSFVGDDLAQKQIVNLSGVAEKLHSPNNKVDNSQKQNNLGETFTSILCNEEDDSTICIKYSDDGSYGTISQKMCIPHENDDKWGVSNPSEKDKSARFKSISNPYRETDCEDLYTAIDTVNSFSIPHSITEESSVIIEEIYGSDDLVKETEQAKTIESTCYSMKDYPSIGYKDIDPDEKYDIVGWEDSLLCDQIAHQFGLQDLYHKIHSSSSTNQGVEIR